MPRVVPLLQIGGMTTLPSHVPIPLYRPWVVDAVSPVPFLSPPADLAVPVSGEMPARQRRKLWELAPHLYCSIIGTCLSTTELRKAVAKFKGQKGSDVRESAQSRFFLWAGASRASPVATAKLSATDLKTRSRQD